MEEKIYNIYESIRDANTVTKEISSTKKLMLSLLENNSEIIEYCIRKSEEEKQEVLDAKIGKHFHKGMTKREILVNEISQYMYWLIIIDVSKKIKYEDTQVFKKIKKIINSIDISEIEETKNVTLDEVIAHDLDNMIQKEYLKCVIENNF